MTEHKKVTALEEQKEQKQEQEQEESFASALMRFIRELFRKLFPTSCKFEEFLEKTGEYFDERIRQRTAKGDVRYAGGKITFTLSGGKVDMASKLYFFNDETEKWTVQEADNSVDKSRFNDWDTDEDLKKLARGEIVELDITAPQ